MVHCITLGVPVEGRSAAQRRPEGEINTVNVDIFACTSFCVLPKIGNFVEIYFGVFDCLASMLHYNSYLYDVHSFADI